MNAEQVVKFCQDVYGTEFCKDPNAANIVYVEGANANLIPNKDLPDKWNDRCLIIQFSPSGAPFIRANYPCTTEPGVSATLSKQAAALGGVARIAFGFHKEKWVLGFHKGNKEHPALVQVDLITVHRDKNKDFKRTADPVTTDVKGLNQHGARKGLRPVRVGGFSLGCLVRELWEDHEEFIAIVSNDPRAIKDRKFKISSTVVDGSKLFSKYGQD